MGDNTPTKLFIGRLPREATVDELKDCFSDYAPLKDVYIPKNFRGFGFVTFNSQSEAQEVLNSTHIIRGNVLNISHPAPKPKEGEAMPMQNNGYGNGNMHGGKWQGNMWGGMQGNMPIGSQGGGYGNRQGRKTNSGYY